MKNLRKNVKSKMETTKTQLRHKRLGDEKWIYLQINPLRFIKEHHLHERKKWISKERKKDRNQKKKKKRKKERKWKKKAKC